MVAIAGLRSTADIVAQYQDRPENWRMGILINEPNGSAPMFALTSMAKSRQVDDPVFHWFEEDVQAYRFAASADHTDTTTTLLLTSGALHLKEGDILRVEQTEELLYVAADPTSDTAVTVIRGFAGSTATAIDFDGAGKNPNVMLIGSAYEEGSRKPSARTFNPDPFYNYTQIFRDTFAITGTNKETEYRTGDPVKEDKRRTVTRHSEGIERSMIFGKRSTGTRNGKPFRTMGGIISQIPAANIAVNGGTYGPNGSGVWTMAGIEAYLAYIFKYGSNEKMVFAGNSFMLGIQQIVRKNADYMLAPVSTEYGMKVRRFITPFGELVLKTHPQFNQIGGGTTAATAYAGLDSWGLIIDWAHLKYVNLRNRDTKYQPDLTEKGDDGEQAGYITECSIELTFPASFGLVKGLTAGAVDA